MIILSPQDLQHRFNNQYYVLHITVFNDSVDDHDEDGSDEYDSDEIDDIITEKRYLVSVKTCKIPIDVDRRLKIFADDRVFCE